MRIMREQLRRDREAVLRVLAQAPESGLAVAGLEVIGTVHNSSDLVEALKELTAKQAELRALRYRYTDEHPPVKRLQASIETLERHTIPALAGALLEEVGLPVHLPDSPPVPARGFADGPEDPRGSVPKVGRLRENADHGMLGD